MQFIRPTNAQRTIPKVVSEEAFYSAPYCIFSTASYSFNLAYQMDSQRKDRSNSIIGINFDGSVGWSIRTPSDYQLNPCISFKYS